MAGSATEILQARAKRRQTGTKDRKTREVKKMETYEELLREEKTKRTELREVLAEIKEKYNLEQIMAEAKFKPHINPAVETPGPNEIVMKLKDNEGKKAGEIAVDRYGAFIKYKGKEYDQRDGKRFLQALGLYKREYKAVQAFMEYMKQEQERVAEARQAVAAALGC